MTIERAIEILNPEHREHYESIEVVNEACRMGMEALKKQQPAVMSREDMIEAVENNEPVYVEESPENSYRHCFWGIAIHGIEAPKDRPYNYPGGVDFNVVDSDGSILDGDFYGLKTPLGWRAWNVKSTEEQMKEASWQ